MSQLGSAAGKRNYGIDLLKMLSMQMIVVLHVLGVGGILGRLEVLSPQYEAMWLLEVACFCGVNCFAIASGYLMVDSRFRYSRLMSIWLQVVYYMAGITLAFAVVFPDTVGFDQWRWAFMPVTTVRYWYFTAYFAMYFFIPFFNKLIDAGGKKTLQRLILSGVIVFIGLTYIARDDIFRLHGGYSFVWLSLLYFIGAYFKRWPIKVRIKPQMYFLGYAVCVVITWLSKLLLQLRNPASDGGILINYISPTMLMAALCLFLGFISMDIRSKGAIKIISFLSPASFSVYLIHCQPLIWHYILPDRFAFAASLPIPVMAAAVLAIASGIYLSCSVFDRLRIWIFKASKVDDGCRKLEATLGRAGEKISRIIDQVL